VLRLRQGYGACTLLGAGGVSCVVTGYEDKFFELTTKL
jgi:hypothetical protein